MPFKINPFTGTLDYYKQPSSSGVNDGDKGDITVSGSGATWTIDNSVVSTAKMGGDVTVQGKALLDDATQADQRATLGLGSAATSDTSAFAAASHTHAQADITNLTTDLAGKQAADATLTALAGLDASAGIVEQTGSDTFTKRAIGVGASTSIPTRGDADTRYAAASHSHAIGDVTNLQTTLDAKVDEGAVTTSNLTMATSKLLGRSTASTGAIEEITLGTNLSFSGTTLNASSAGLSDGDKGDITVSASGATWTIDNGVVTLAKQADIATDRLIGRDTAGTGVPEALTVGGGIEFTGAGGIQTSALTGDVTKTAGGTATTIANDAVTYAKMQNASAGNVVLTRAAATSGDYGETALAASQLLGRGSTGDVAAISLGTGIKLNGTTLNSPVVFVANGADTAVNTLADTPIVSRDVTDVGTTDKLVVEADFIILNNSGAARVYVITLDFDGLFDVEFSTGSLANSATLMHPFYIRGQLDIRSSSLCYATFVCEGQLAAGIASGTDTSMVATHLRAMGWGTSASNASGTTTVSLNVRSASNTATQTLYLGRFVISKYTPT